MSLGSDQGTVDQKIEALVMITAIAPPSKDELIQRTLSVTFEHQHHGSSLDPGGVLRSVRGGSVVRGIFNEKSRKA